MAACVAVDEQSKLVAEDLWNGFDDEFLDVDKDRLVRFNGFFPKPQSGTYLILDEGGYQVAGQKGTWLVSDEVEVDGQRFVQMRSEQTKNPPPSIILHESGAFVTQTALGFDGEATRKITNTSLSSSSFIATPNSSSRIFFFSVVALVEWNNEPECFGTSWLGVYKPRCRFLIPKASR